VTLAIPVPVGIKARFVACNIKGKHIKIGLKGPPIMDSTYSTTFSNSCPFNNVDLNALQAGKDMDLV